MDEKKIVFFNCEPKMSLDDIFIRGKNYIISRNIEFLKDINIDSIVLEYSVNSDLLKGLKEISDAPIIAMIVGSFNQKLLNNSFIEGYSSVIFTESKHKVYPVKNICESKISYDNINILIAESFKHGQIKLTHALKKNNYKHYFVVENGYDAIEFAKHKNFDLMLINMYMPIMNGFEAVKQIRLIPKYEQTPILGLNTIAMRRDAEKTLDSGVTDYLGLPIESMSLIGKINYYLSD